MKNENILIEALELIAGRVDYNGLAIDTAKKCYLEQKRLEWINSHEKGDCVTLAGSPESLCIDIARKALQIYREQSDKTQKT